MIKVASFNVNGIRARLGLLLEFLETHSPDLVGLQETKVTDQEFPAEPLADLGYELLIHGQKTHYGVAMLSKKSPADRQTGLEKDEPNEQKRFVYASYPLKNGQKLHAINAYFPQGENRKHPAKFPHKQRFYERLQEFVRNGFSSSDFVLIMGDFNISPTDKDVGIGEKNAARWLKEGKCSFLPEEREWYQRFFEAGFHDTFRLFHPESADTFSWFDYRSKGFDDDPKRGLRIDHILVTEALRNLCTGCTVDYETRAKPQPSDHCPVIADFDLEW